MPQLLADPIQVTENYREYKAAVGDESYLVPVRMIVAAESNRACAIMLESHDGKRAIFLAIVGPPPLSEEGSVQRRSVLYPVDKMFVRTLTSSQDSSIWRVTTTSEPLKLQPFTFLVSIQVFGRRNISDFKAMLRGKEGFLLEAGFVINTTSNSRLQIGVPVSLGNLNITEQTM